MPLTPSGITVDSLRRPRLQRRAAAAATAASADRLAVDLVAAEQLVGALAGQHHGHVAGRAPGQEVQRDQRGVGHRVVEVPHDPGQRLDDVVRRDERGRQPHAELVGGLAAATSISE